MLTTCPECYNGINKNTCKFCLGEGTIYEEDMVDYKIKNEENN